MVSPLICRSHSSMPPSRQESSLLWLFSALLLLLSLLLKQTHGEYLYTWDHKSPNAKENQIRLFEQGSSTSSSKTETRQVDAEEVRGSVCYAVNIEKLEKLILKTIQAAESAAKPSVSAPLTSSSQTEELPWTSAHHYCNIYCSATANPSNVGCEHCECVGLFPPHPKAKVASSASHGKIAGGFSAPQRATEDEPLPYIFAECGSVTVGINPFSFVPYVSSDGSLQNTLQNAKKDKSIEPVSRFNVEALMEAKKQAVRYGGLQQLQNCQISNRPLILVDGHKDAATWKGFDYRWQSEEHQEAGGKIKPRKGKETKAKTVINEDKKAMPSPSAVSSVSVSRNYESSNKVIFSPRERPFLSVRKQDAISSASISEAPARRDSRRLTNDAVTDVHTEPTTETRIGKEPEEGEEQELSSGPTAELTAKPSTESTTTLIARTMPKLPRLSLPTKPLIETEIFFSPRFMPTTTPSPSTEASATEPESSAPNSPAPSVKEPREEVTEPTPETPTAPSTAPSAPDLTSDQIAVSYFVKLDEVPSSDLFSLLSNVVGGDHNVYYVPTSDYIFELFLTSSKASSLSQFTGVDFVLKKPSIFKLSPALLAAIADAVAFRSVEELPAIALYRNPDIALTRLELANLLNAEIQSLFGMRNFVKIRSGELTVPPVPNMIFYLEIIRYLVSRRPILQLELKKHVSLADPEELLQEHDEKEGPSTRAKDVKAQSKTRQGPGSQDETARSASDIKKIVNLQSREDKFKLKESQKSTAEQAGEDTLHDEKDAKTGVHKKKDEKTNINMLKDIDPRNHKRRRLDVHSDHLIGAAALRAPPLSLSGQNLLAACVDTGVYAYHDQFLTPNRAPPYDLFDPLQRKLLMYLPFAGNCVDETPLDKSSDGTCGHGTHVCGIIAGSSASGSVRDVGTAPEAKLIVIDIGRLNDAGEVEIVSPATPEELFDRSYEKGARIFSISYGNDAYGYDAKAAGFDRYLSEHPDVIALVAAGNGGDGEEMPYKLKKNCRGGMTSSPAIAKNVITIGASLNTRESFSPAACQAFNPKNLAHFSAKGPSPDGRRKPDIVCPGYSIQSARSLPLESYKKQEKTSMLCLSQGTSQSTPVCTGAALMVYQWLIEGKYVDGTTRPQAAMSSPPSALVKALLIFSGTPLTGWLPQKRASNCEAIWNLTRPTTYGDYAQGFGKVDLLHLIRAGVAFNQTLQHQQHSSKALPPVFFAPHNNGEESRGANVSEVNMGKTNEYRFDVHCGSAFKAVLVWTDPVTSTNIGDGCESVLVNDLDLSAAIDNLDGTTTTVYPVGMENRPDKLNNVEVVFVRTNTLNCELGTVRQVKILVSGTAIRHGRAQKYALVAAEVDSYFLAGAKPAIIDEPDVLPSYWLAWMSYGLIAGCSVLAVAAAAFFIARHIQRNKLRQELLTTRCRRMSVMGRLPVISRNSNCRNSSSSIGFRGSHCGGVAGGGSLAGPPSFTHRPSFIIKRGLMSNGLNARGGSTSLPSSRSSQTTQTFSTFGSQPPSSLGSQTPRISHLTRSSGGSAGDGIVGSRLSPDLSLHSPPLPPDSRIQSERAMDIQLKSLTEEVVRAIREQSSQGQDRGHAYCTEVRDTSEREERIGGVTSEVIEHRLEATKQQLPVTFPWTNGPREQDCSEDGASYVPFHTPRDSKSRDESQL